MSSNAPGARSIKVQTAVPLSPIVMLLRTLSSVHGIKAFQQANVKLLLPLMVKMIRRA